MPEFDTYKGIERYAKHPDDIEAVQSFHWLMRRTKRQLIWRAISVLGLEGLELGYRLQLGCTDEGAPEQSNTFDPDVLPKLSQEDRDTAYLELCKSVGITVDPAALSRGSATKNEHK